MSRLHTTHYGMAEGVALAHTLVGEPLEGSGGVEHANGDIQLATEYSTAPYKRRKRDNPNMKLCQFEKEDGSQCKGFQLKDTDYCAGHSKSLGLVSWSNHPKKDVGNDDTGRTEGAGSATD